LNGNANYPKNFCQKLRELLIHKNGYNECKIIRSMVTSKLSSVSDLPNWLGSPVSYHTKEWSTVMFFVISQFAALRNWWTGNLSATTGVRRGAIVTTDRGIILDSMNERDAVKFT
jgi:hypothetical protein